MKPKHLPLLTILIPSFFFLLIQQSKTLDPTPSPWPLQFHSLLIIKINETRLQVVDLWYDWPNGRNLNLIQNQLGTLKYDVEWTNGTSFIFTDTSCRILNFSVGILRPNWLDGATYLGQEKLDGFLCNVWTKVDFIRYYEDVVSKRPVSWAFFNGMTAHVMTFEVGAVLEDSKWQAPVYCFGKREVELEDESGYCDDGKLIRDIYSSASI